MSPAQLALFMRTHAKIATLRPDVAASVVRAWATIANAFSESELADLITAGYADRLIAEALSDQMLDRALVPLRERMRTVVRSGFQYTLPSLPNGGKIDGTLVVTFDSLSPDVLRAIRTLETPVVSRLTDDVRDVVRARVTQGLVDGEAPRTIARDLRSVIGLGPSQYEQIQRYREALTTGDITAVKRYTLRSKTVDRMMANGPLSEKQIATEIQRYTKRRIALNAETTARTATLDAFKLGQRLSWQAAIDSGVVPPGRQLMKQWIGVMDERERPEHVAMENETVPFDEPFSNGEMVPGESTYNCRCIARYYLGRAA